MVIEFLKFTVPLAEQAAFLAADAAIWTPALATSPGFLGKEVWASGNDVRLVIRWRAQADWDAMERGMLAATQAEFVAALGLDYPVLSCTAFTALRQA